MVKDFGTNLGFGGPFVNFNGTLFFAGEDPDHGTELWKSDGSTAGTVLVADINPGSGSSSPRDFTFVNDTLYFTATDGVNGRQVWKTDGTAAGTVPVTIINPGNPNGLNISSPSLTNVNGTLFWLAKDGLQGYQLWKTDGTDEGTGLVKEISTGNLILPAPNNLVNVNGTLFFVATDSVNGTRLWKSDGTEEGTVIVANTAGSNLVNGNGTLYFTTLVTVNGQSQSQVWQSDGTAAGTFSVFSTGLTDGPASLTRVNDKLFFSAGDPSHGRELWMIGLGVPAAPAVQSMVVNDGSASRPSVKSLTVASTTFVTLSPGALEVQRQDQTVSSVLLNEGDTSGSQVRSITFHFSDVVTLDAGAFDLFRSDGTKVGLVLTTSVVDGKTMAVLTFTGPDLIDGALPDGSYTIVVQGDAIHNSQGQALGGAFLGDNAADFFGTDGSGQCDLVSQFHPFP
jgi:ELWxxDGT repeat protein